MVQMSILEKLGYIFDVLIASKLPFLLLVLLIFFYYKDSDLDKIISGPGRQDETK